MKVIVSDFDETFYDANFVDNINLVNKWQKSGNNFVIATGRGLHSLRNIIDNYSIKADYYICNDGAVIYDRIIMKYIVRIWIIMFLKKYSIICLQQIILNKYLLIILIM